MCVLSVRAGIAVTLLWLTVAAFADEAGPSDPFWTLVHDEAVLDDLKLAAEQRSQWRAVLDVLDLRCFPLRNRPAAEADGGFAKLNADAKAQLGKILKSAQTQRLDQIIVRVQGPAALVRDDLAAKLKLTDKQRGEIRQAIAGANESRTKLQQNLRAAKMDTAAAEKELAKINADERDAVNAVLTSEQKQRLVGLYASDFDGSKLGRTFYKTPDLMGDSDAWLNSAPLAPAALRGKVVVVHYFAFGCINCIHNYPTYREWQEELAGKDVQIIGIHTPETKAEHNVETLTSKLKAEALNFPVIVDNAKANWDAWGNSMWPSVYVLDKQGYMRAFWAGELKWQGATGDKQMRQMMDKLLAEK